MLRVCLAFAWRKVLLEIVYWFKSKFPPSELTQITKTLMASEVVVRNEATFLNFTSTWCQPGLRYLGFPTSWNSGGTFYCFHALLCGHTEPDSLDLPLFLSLSLSGTLPHSHTRPQVLQIFACRWWLWSKKVSSVVAVKGRLSQDMENEHCSPCLKICTWWGEGSRKAEWQETGIHPCTCIALAQLHLKPENIKTKRTWRSLLPPITVLIWFKVYQECQPIL